MPNVLSTNLTLLKGHTEKLIKFTPQDHQKAFLDDYLGVLVIIQNSRDLNSGNVIHLVAPDVDLTKPTGKEATIKLLILKLKLQK